MTQNNPYVPRFENMLKSLQSKLSQLETKLDSIKDDHPDKQQSRLNVLEEISKTKQEIQITEKNLECSKEMKVIRSDKVPSNVEDHNVWNDCWYDEEKKAFVTFNQYFAESTNARTMEPISPSPKNTANTNPEIIRLSVVRKTKNVTRIPAKSMTVCLIETFPIGKDIDFWFSTESFSNVTRSMFLVLIFLRYYVSFV